jgi:hypothetical protein
VQGASNRTGRLWDPRSKWSVDVWIDGQLSVPRLRGVGEKHLICPIFCCFDGAGAIEHCQAARIAAVRGFSSIHATMPAFAKNRSITDADMAYRLFAHSG